MKVRRRTIALYLFSGLLVLFGGGALVLRATVVSPRFDVPSIAGAAEYQDPALLGRAFALPVAAAYAADAGRGGLVYQSNGSTCGPSTLANLLRSFGQAGATEDAVRSATGLCWTGLCFDGLSGGLTLDQVADGARRLTGRRVTVLRDLTLLELRQHLARANDPGRRYLVNFHRGLLFGSGSGHHSPIGGYLLDRDLVLVLDVNRRFGPWLVPAPRLHAAIDAVDSTSGQKRGLLLIE